MKECFKCGAVKPLSEFYEHQKMADGHVNKCKECNKKDNRANRNANIEKCREYDRDRANESHRVAGRKNYSTSERGKRSRDQSRKKYIENNPKKREAHIIVGNAIRDGLIQKLPCSVCNSSDAVAHHCDYDKPLDILWLCPLHHTEWHRLNGEGKN